MNNTGKPKALIAMSGGVDSTVAALQAVRMGYECTGVTMKLIQGSKSDAASRTAAYAAALLGIEHLIIDLTKEFNEEVIKPFVCAYESGSTPNPCINCNIRIKFGFLYEYALKKGFRKLITGHYARIVSDGGLPRLARAADRDKDQSYFLYNLTSEKLSKILFPLGDLSKQDVRAIAAEAGLENAGGEESQDICFIQNGGHAEYIENYRGKPLAPGNFIDISGNVLGQHEGVARYTLGQRKGLGVAFGKPAFVKEIRAETAEVVLSDESEIFADRIEIEEVNLINKVVPDRAMVMIRYRAAPVWAAVKKTEEGRLSLLLDQPARAPAKGQAAVLYNGDLVLGGGRIT